MIFYNYCFTSTKIISLKCYIYMEDHLMGKKDVKA
jgi:hypothetical protein